VVVDEVLMRQCILAAVLLGALAPGCDTRSADSDGGGDELDRTVVTSLPEGDAQGDGFSGSYETLTTAHACVGECGPIEMGSTTSVVCSPYDETVELFTVYQEDGSLRMDLDDDGHIGINLEGYVPVRLNGGIDADGSWEVGGYGTKFGGRLESTARIRGTHKDGEPLEGTVEVHVFGVVGETEIDCRLSNELVSLEVRE
jgi:hypothetical protein